MAHWAEIDENNKVIQVVVGDNNDPAGDEGYQWLIDNLGGTWIKTSYNSYGGVHYSVDKNGNKTPSGKPHLRYNFAATGYSYDSTNDAFVPPKLSFIDENGNFVELNCVLNTNTFLWEPVIPS